ncbi:non-hydrolyzing UDP-N-acetylglucosamine 2-epimerase [Cohnella zeiphila]|uniref:UDP-N-acetylglucosamine 2-epimerase (Non-hydrolyzing) n=1 Tax=Cohnella zeiphila TaxID=2761120 RepID=A0A7X0VWK1_9BACL|nr:UDP-N-acetylglucosamine 2-epimerase (non-hydrolyzing) [Cohnella zeiphila]MBB6733056.1 UDP-N-acetylglucosamine 2-epimerase (non-hydrolyzing) [Cohnella zeiphila]
MEKIVTIVGARPQFIKVAPVSRALRQSFREVIVNTGQHYDFNMAGQFFDELEIPRPDYDLEVGSHSHGKQTGLMLQAIEEVLLQEKPDGVIVYGDTNSTLAGALAASKLHIPLFHVEAGLRSYNKAMPEEINRVLTDHVSDLLFAPTETAVKNLERESIADPVRLCGDVMYDAVVYNREIAGRRYGPERYGVERKAYYLCTIHRAENTDRPERLGAIIDSLIRLEAPVLLPLHPRTQKVLRELGRLDVLARHDHIRLIEPVSYMEMLALETEAAAIVTDSGGVQKEAYFARVPCFTLRDETEWMETVEAGWNKLIDPLRMDLKSEIERLEIAAYQDRLYGDGRASEKIVGAIQAYYHSKVSECWF